MFPLPRIGVHDAHATHTLARLDDVDDAPRAKIRERRSRDGQESALVVNRFRQLSAGSRQQSQHG
jgi:hypothetical protein